MCKKLKKLLTKIYSLLFRIEEVRSAKQKEVFTNLWQTTWLAEGYATVENLESVAAHYRNFDRDSTDFILYLLFIPIGTIRLIRNSQRGLPTLTDFQVVKKCWDEKRVLEITLFAVLPRFRGRGLASLLLMRQFYRWARQHGFRWAVMAADVRLFRLLKRLFSSVIQIGEGKEYEGSYTIPACIDLDIEEKEMPKRNPSLYKFFRGRQ